MENIKIPFIQNRVDHFNRFKDINKKMIETTGQGIDASREAGNSWPRRNKRLQMMTSGERLPSLK